MAKKKATEKPKEEKKVTIKEVTVEQLAEFINKQKDDRPIEMGEDSSDDKVGCILVHFGKEELKLTDFIVPAGDWLEKAPPALGKYRKVLAKLKGAHDGYRFLFNYLGATTYKEAKAYGKVKEEEVVNEETA